jgi:hypothetical protein
LDDRQEVFREYGYENLLGSGPLRDRRDEDNIKMDLREAGYANG